MADQDLISSCRAALRNPKPGSRNPKPILHPCKGHIYRERESARARARERDRERERERERGSERECVAEREGAVACAKLAAAAAPITMGKKKPHGDEHQATQ